MFAIGKHPEAWFEVEGAHLSPSEFSLIIFDEPRGGESP